MFAKLTKANHYKDLSNLPVKGRLDSLLRVGCAYYSGWAVDLNKIVTPKLEAISRYSGRHA